MQSKPFTYFLCIVALILIFSSPLLIVSIYDQQPDSVPYKGILSMWHITDWRTGGSSGATFLKKRIKEFEANNAYVFIELTSMSITQANEAIMTGNAPDIISFPASFDAGFQMAALPAKPIGNTFESVNNAYPYMCGGYCILVNCEMLEAQGVLPPSGWGIRPDTLLEAVQLGVCFDAEQGYSALAAMALHEYPVLEGPNINTWGTPKLPDAMLGMCSEPMMGGLDVFCAGDACVLIASHRQLFDAGQRYDQNEAPAFAAFAIGGYSDMVQQIGVIASNEPKKQAVCTAFAEYLVSDSAQRKLDALGVFPVVSGLEIYENNECQNMMYRLLENAVYVDPDQNQTLEELAKQAFDGDARALKRLRALLRKSS